MIASAQFTIISLCDVVTSDTPPENPYEGQLWVDTSVTPPETKIWDGNEWVVQNDIETIRTTISILTEKDAQFQQTIDGLNSYVATLTETVETVSNDQGVLEERVLNSESRVSELEHTVDGLSVTMQEQYIGGINYVQNSSGLNGITDDWSYSGTVKTDTSTDTQNNTISDSCFVLGAYSSLSQYIRGVVPGTYTISVRAKKTSTMSGYFYVTYNGNKTKYLFNKSTAFDWTDYSVTLTDVTDPTLRIYCYCRDASIYLADIMISEGSIPRKWTPAPNEIYTQEVKIDKRGIEVPKRKKSMRAKCRSTMWSTAMSRLLHQRSSTRCRPNLSGANESVANTAERAFFLPASSAGTAAPTLARKSGTRPQNTAGSSGNATANSRVSTNAKRRIWTRKPLKRGS